MILDIIQAVILGQLSTNIIVPLVLLVLGVVLHLVFYTKIGISFGISIVTSLSIVLFGVSLWYYLINKL